MECPCTCVHVWSHSLPSLPVSHTVKVKKHVARVGSGSSEAEDLISRPVWATPWVQSQCRITLTRQHQKGQKVLSESIDSPVIEHVVSMHRNLRPTSSILPRSEFEKIKMLLEEWRGGWRDLLASISQVLGEKALLPHPAHSTFLQVLFLETGFMRSRSHQTH